MTATRLRLPYTRAMRLMNQRCPKSAGAAAVQWDTHAGWFWYCLQCGRDYYPRRDRNGTEAAPAGTE